MAVDEPRQNGEGRQVDFPRAGRDGHRRPYGLEPAVFDQHDGARHDRAALRIDQPPGLHGQDLGGSLRCGRREAQEENDAA
ncbi:MAG TPA: hypothetical protein VGL03_09430 [Thermoanaerobaculia bacterium]